MPLTNEQKSYLIFKEFLQLPEEFFDNRDIVSDGCKGTGNGTSKEKFDTKPEKVQSEGSSVPKNIPPSDVNPEAVKKSGQQLIQFGDQTNQEAIKNRVNQYRSAVEHLYNNQTAVSYKMFKEFMMNLLNNDYESDREECYKIVMKIASDVKLRTTYGTRYIWNFLDLVNNMFPIEAGKLYDKNDGTRV